MWVCAGGAEDVVSWPRMQRVRYAAVGDAILLLLPAPPVYSGLSGEIFWQYAMCTDALQVRHADVLGLGLA